MWDLKKNLMIYRLLFSESIKEHVKYRGRYQKLETTFFITACIYDPKNSNT